jgi:hypothetical protein
MSSGELIEWDEVVRMKGRGEREGVVFFGVERMVKEV